MNKRLSKIVVTLMLAAGLTGGLSTAASAQSFSVQFGHPVYSTPVYTDAYGNPVYTDAFGNPVYAPTYYHRYHWWHW